MAPPLLGLTFAGTFVGDPVTLVVLVGVFLIESPVDDALVVSKGEGLGAISGGVPAVVPEGAGSPWSGSILGIVVRLGAVGDGCGGCWALLRLPVITMVS